MQVACSFKQENGNVYIKTEDGDEVEIAYEDVRTLLQVTLTVIRVNGTPEEKELAMIICKANLGH